MDINKAKRIQRYVDYTRLTIVLAVIILLTTLSVCGSN